MATQYSPERIAKILDEYEKTDLTMDGFCKKVKVHPNTIYKWLRKSRETKGRPKGPPAPGPTREIKAAIKNAEVAAMTETVTLIVRGVTLTLPPADAVKVLQAMTA